MNEKTTLGLALLVAAVTAACGLEVDSVSRSDASRAFREAERRIESAERVDVRRRGKVRRFHLLAYDGDEGKLVRLNLPAGVFCWNGKRRDLPFGFDIDADWRRRGPLSDRHRDWSARDIVAFGPGLLLEASERNDRVLIWME